MSLIEILLYEFIEERRHNHNSGRWLTWTPWYIAYVSFKSLQDNMYACLCSSQVDTVVLEKALS